MRIEDLKKRITQMSDEELTRTIEEWRNKRELYTVNNPAPKKRASKVRENKVKNLILSLSPEEQKALLLEFAE